MDTERDQTRDERPGTGQGSGTVTLRYWAAARAAAGRESDLVEIGSAASLADLLVQARDRHDAQFARVLASCSVLVEDRPVGTADPTAVPITAGATVEFLPPFAGG